MEAYLDGILVNHALVREEEAALDIARGITRSGFSTYAPNHALGPRTLRVVLRFSGAQHDARARAAMSLLQHAGPNVLWAADVADTMWGSTRALALRPSSRVRLTFEGAYRVVTFDATYLGGAEDQAWTILATSTIQESPFARAGTTRLFLPGESTLRGGGGSEATTGRWVTDPAEYAGEPYAANASMSNYADPTVLEVNAADWAHGTPYLVPGPNHLTSLTAIGTAVDDASALVDLLGEEGLWVLLHVQATYSGTDPALLAKLLARRGALGVTTMGTMLAPMRMTSGAHEWLAAAYIHRGAQDIYDAALTGAEADLTARSLTVYRLEEAWALDAGERYSNLLVGIGAAQLWIQGGALHMNACLLEGEKKAATVLLDSGASWWRLQHATRDSVRLTSNTEDELILFPNGVVELVTRAASFRVLPGDTAKALGSHSYRPHSARDLYITSLEDFTASAAGGVATISTPTTGQRMGLMLDSDLEPFFRRTRTTWTVRG